MTCWAMGVPGEPVRQYLTGDVEPLLPDDWVAIEAAGPGGRCRISQDGTAIEVIPVTIADRRDQRWAQARAWREAYAAGGCMTALGRVDTDEASRQKISGAVQLAMVAAMTGAAFDPIAWTMSDNSVVTHDATEMIGMGVAVGRFIDACQQAGTAIRASIYASNDPESIDITAGYPAQEEI